MIDSPGASRCSRQETAGGADLAIGRLAGGKPLTYCFIYGLVMVRERLSKETAGCRRSCGKPGRFQGIRVGCGRWTRPGHRRAGHQKETSPVRAGTARARRCVNSQRQGLYPARVLAEVNRLWLPPSVAGTCRLSGQGGEEQWQSHRYIIARSLFIPQQETSHAEIHY